ncbi:putative oxidoreductase [Nocardioides dokdonensis FR1436]|uniref:Putative oxidoreductase n=1 Tax=Nocardioides dokdonensis FR1436 TaxID=1300347 RepID=A0A1A9GJ31_9ACTN|nr:SDR family NAD(P)-dependent oxidoreductase [Nocardioides dokdonensis]ANH38264.1 putative oxidoreductase [Nocardioides dokdonensis FR1436]
MKIEGARVLVAGATGVLGRAVAAGLHERGARVVAAGRDAARLAEVAGALGTSGRHLDVVDVDSCGDAVRGAVEELGGLDLLVVATGAAGFGRATELDEAVAEELFAVNTLGPMALVRAAAPYLAEARDGEGTAAVLSAVLADLPTAGMADYSAAKAALATWLQVLRREERRSFRVLDVRPPHLDTGLETRALAGSAPRLPASMPHEQVISAILDAVGGDATEIVMDGKEMVLR